MNKLVIDLANLPEEGKYYEGELDPAIFEFGEKDPRPLRALRYKIDVQRFEDELLLRGHLSCTFEMECVRTLHPFILTLDLPEAAVAIEVKGESEIDVSQALREELLIEMPNYPTCELGDEPGNCQIDPRYLAVDNPGDDELNTPPPAGGDNRWAALDALGTPPKPAQKSESL